MDVRAIQPFSNLFAGAAACVGVLASASSSSSIAFTDAGSSGILNIAEAARWAPTGANAQCFDLVIVDEPAVRDAVIEIFVEQS